MAEKSNFRRAMPQAQPAVLASLRTTQMVDESKAILPAGVYCQYSEGEAPTNSFRTHQYNPRLPPCHRYVLFRPDLEAHAGNGVRRHPLDTKVEEHGLLERCRGQTTV